MNYQATNILEFWLSMTVVWVWLNFFWRPYRLDLLRENLFALRDELFLYAQQEEGISFEHPAYRGLREDLNGLIRFAEKMTVARALLTLLYIKMRHRETERPEWQTHLAGLPLHVQKRLLAIHMLEAAEIANYVIGISPLSLVLFLVLRWIARVSHIVSLLLNRIRELIARPLEEQARDYRMAS